VQLSLCCEENEHTIFMQRSRCNASSVRPELGSQPQKGGCVMKLGKLFSVIAAVATVSVAALAQPTEANVVWLAVKDLGSSITFDPNLISTPAPDNQNSIDLGGRGGIRFIQVTTYARFTPDSTLGRLGLINTYVPVTGIPGVSVVDDFPPNRWDGGATTRSDARKNAYSHDVGNRDIDSAGNDLADNSARPYDTTFTSRAGAGAAGKSLFPGGASDPGEGALYSFIIRVDTEIAPLQIDLAFGRVGGTNRVALRTNFGYEFSQDFAPAAYGATILVPEPASMIALGSGLVGLLALRRRRSN
jgi:hypothetical protein